MQMQKTVRIGRLPLRVEVSELENGVTVASVRNEELKDRETAITIAILHGKRYETRKKAEFSHLIEHLAVVGARSARERHKNALHWSGSTYEANSCVDHVRFDLKVPTCAAAELLFPLFAVDIQEPGFDADTFAAQKDIVGVELKRIFYDDNEQYAIDLAYARLFAKENPLSISISDSLLNLDTISLNDIRECHRKYYTPRRIIVAAGGRFPHRKLVELSRNAFGGLPARRINDAFPMETHRPTGRLAYTEERSRTSSFLAIGFNASKLLQVPEDHTAFEVLRSILVTRLYKRAHDLRSYEPNIEFHRSRWAAAVIVCADFGSPVRMEAGEKVLIEEIKRLQDHLVSPEELRGHARSKRASIRSTDVYSPDELRNELFQRLLDKAPQNIFRQYEECAAVTRSDIRRLARTCFSMDQHTVIKIRGMDHAA